MHIDRKYVFRYNTIKPWKKFKRKSHNSRIPLVTSVTFGLTENIQQTTYAEAITWNQKLSSWNSFSLKPYRMKKKWTFDLLLTLLTYCLKQILKRFWKEQTSKHFRCNLNGQNVVKWSNMSFCSKKWNLKWFLIETKIVKKIYKKFSWYIRCGEKWHKKQGQR